jgi:molecular chaperone GrpE
LTIVDDLERALAHADPDDPIVAGVKATRDHAVALVEQLGFVRLDETGVAFDPARHDAVGVRDAGDARPGTVLEVLRPGYGTGAHQLRPASVVVAG